MISVLEIRLNTDCEISMISQSLSALPAAIFAAGESQ
jgi:hypothetical protein